MTVTVASFYKFVRIEDPAALRATLHATLAARAMKGTVLVAPEGINGTVSGEPDEVRAVLAEIRVDHRFTDLVHKEGTAQTHPFRRLKVRLKREIITLRRPEADPIRQTGAFVSPRDWNTLIAQPDVIVIDTRNAYEVAEGSFVGAVNPDTRHFGEFPAFVARDLDPARHRRIAMFCTGGIRCEKASAYLLAHGFTEVYQLDGGILRYLAEIPEGDSMWQGRCFVFDERGGIDGQIPASDGAR